MFQDVPRTLHLSPYVLKNYKIATRLNGMFLEHSGTDGTSKNLDVPHEVIRTDRAYKFDVDPDAGRLVTDANFFVLVSLGTHLRVELGSRPSAPLIWGCDANVERDFGMRHGQYFLSM
jgi:hypothetical protein